MTTESALYTDAEFDLVKDNLIQEGFDVVERDGFFYPSQFGCTNDDLDFVAQEDAWVFLDEHKYTGIF